MKRLSQRLLRSAPAPTLDSRRKDSKYLSTSFFEDSSALRATGVISTLHLSMLKPYFLKTDVKAAITPYTPEALYSALTY